MTFTSSYKTPLTSSKCSQFCCVIWLYCWSESVMQAPLCICLCVWCVSATKRLHLFAMGIADLYETASPLPLSLRPSLPKIISAQRWTLKAPCWTPLFMVRDKPEPVSHETHGYMPCAGSHISKMSDSAKTQFHWLMDSLLQHWITIGLPLSNCIKFQKCNAFVKKVKPQLP